MEYLYGLGIARYFPWSELSYLVSRNSNRLKTVMRNKRVFATIKENGIVALSYDCASFMLKTRRFRDSCIFIRDEAVEPVSHGKSLFCKHVVRVGKNVRPGLDVGLLDKNGRLVAVGRALLPASYMMSFQHGPAVRVREGFKSR
jgi:uncharacterized protein with predicted RNA binding PUA domain